MTRAERLFKRIKNLFPKAGNGDASYCVGGAYVVFSSLGRNDFTCVEGCEIDERGNLLVWGVDIKTLSPEGDKKEQYNVVFPAGKWDLLRWPS